jgi:hypothetical protein
MYGFNVARRWLALAVTALFLGHALSTAALAQSSGTGGMALDGREHPGSLEGALASPNKAPSARDSGRATFRRQA